MSTRGPVTGGPSNLTRAPHSASNKTRREMPSAYDDFFRNSFSERDLAASVFVALCACMPPAFVIFGVLIYQYLVP